MNALVSCDRSLCWLGQIENPNGLVPLKYVTRINSELLSESTAAEFLIHYIDIGNIDSTGRISQVNKFTFKNSPSRARRKVQPGDIIVSTVRTYLKTIAYIDQNDSSLVASTGFVVLSARKNILYPRYLYYWMRSNLVVNELCARSVGASYPATNAAEIGSIPIPISPVKQQRSIAEFLDRKTISIDTLITKKQHFIQLLEEKRTALIRHAVTQGLDPNAPMKASQIPWIGKIPEHWDLVPLKWIARTESGTTPASKNRISYYQNGSIPWVRTLDLNNGEVWNTALKITPQALRDTACKIMPPGTVMVAMYGGSGTIGKHGILRIPSATNQAICSIVFDPGFDPEFMHYYFQFYRPYWMVRAVGSRRDPNINQEIIRNVRVICPRFNEQIKIANVLNGKVTKIEKMVAIVQQSIEKLQEYQCSLIAAAVTDKLDINSVAEGNG